MKARIIILGLLLTGCQIAPNFDTNQYFLLTGMKEDATRLGQQCPNLQAQDIQNSLKYKSEELVIYSQYLPADSNVYQAAQVIDTMIANLIKHYLTPSDPKSAYCAIQLQNIKDGVDKIQHAMSILER